MVSLIKKSKYRLLAHKSGDLSQLSHSSSLLLTIRRMIVLATMSCGKGSGRACSRETQCSNASFISAHVSAPTILLANDKR